NIFIFFIFQNKVQMKIIILFLISVISISCLSEPKKNNSNKLNSKILKESSTQLDKQQDHKLEKQEEFLMEELIYPEAIDSPNFGGFINISSEPIIQGIIIKVEKTDPSGGGFAEYFDKEPTLNNYVITLQLLNFEENEVYKNKGFSGIQEFY